MKRQLKLMGLSIDWDLEISTCDESYYKHQQEIFIDFYNKGFVKKKKIMLTGIQSNRQFWRMSKLLTAKGGDLGQLWKGKNYLSGFDITKFSEDLLLGLENLENWPDKVKTMQKNWIGKSLGCEIKFNLIDSEEKLTVFTTRPDTIFGATFIAVSADHPICKKFKDNKDFEEFKKECLKVGTTEEALANAEKNGFNTALYANHPFKKDKKLPIYVANFILMDYGTGAIFGCPAHDQRDFDFAKKYKLEIIKVVSDNNTLKINHKI